MKSIKHRLLSLLLTLVTVLSLLPTAAFAASNTGSGLKITTNQAYWSTRLLANGTPYSYRPPLVDGKLVYCMDSGLGYHYATASYLNSFTWTSGTGADADKGGLCTGRNALYLRHCPQRSCQQLRNCECGGCGWPLQWAVDSGGVPLAYHGLR